MADDPPAEFDDTAVALAPCRMCGRTFRSSILEKHEVICEKAKQKQRKRKVFDSGKMRAEGTEIPLSNMIRPGQKVPASAATPAAQQGKNTASAKKSKWREQHESFITAIRAARSAADAEKRGEEVLPPPRAAVPSDYKQCPHCGRNFNQHAAERHVPFCKEQKSRMAAKNSPSQATQARSEARKYQPPPPGGLGSRRAVSSEVPKSRYGNHSVANSRGGSRISMRQNKTGTNSRANGHVTGGGSRNEQLQQRLFASVTPPAPAAPPPGSNSGTYQQMHSTGTTNYYSSNSPAYVPRYRHIHRREGGSNGGGDTISWPTSSSSSASSSGRPSQNYNSTYTSSTGLRQKSNSSQSSMNSSSSTPTSRTANYTRPRQMNGYHSGLPTIRPPLPTSAGGKAKFCHDCGTRYPVDTAKFCCECGVKRLHITHD